MKANEIETLYITAKEAYYAGTPIMTDSEFDELEQSLIELGSTLTESVGSKIKGSKKNHLTPMLSLQKVQVNSETLTEEAETAILNFMSKAEVQYFTFTPKFDGNAVNLIYKNGKLVNAITRGDGKCGQDITNKIKYIVPNEIVCLDTVEIRGEVVIPKTIFYDKYATEYKNPRNFVAGMLNRDKLDIAICKDLVFMAFDIKTDSTNQAFKTYTHENLLNSFGFNKTYPLYVKYGLHGDLKDLYADFLNYKYNSSEFQLDGFVIKYQENMRSFLKETDHHPNWAIAVKFPPKVGITKIKDIEWNIGNTGELIPIAILNPVDLDGSTVSRVILHNLGYILSMKCFIGSTVKIVKSGDIIPKIIEVIESSTEELDIPNNYKGVPTYIDGVHLIASNSDLIPDVQIRKLCKAIGALNIKNVGYSTIKKLYDSGITTILDFFIMTKDLLIDTGNFKQGRALDIIFEERSKIKFIHLAELIYMMDYNNVGWTMSKQLAKYYSGVDYNFKGFDKSIITSLIKGSDRYNTIINLLQEFEKIGIPIIPESNEVVVEYIGTYEMTGSPKEFGFASKDEFTKFAKEHGFKHSKLSKDCTMLITDSLESTSSKMETAKKLGITIITYSQFKDLLK